MNKTVNSTQSAVKKCYVLIISRFFPKTHPKAGEHTHFLESIELGLKIHTIRGNYELWKKRIDEVNAGKAYISRRYWSGEPYKSKQVEYDQLYKVGIQKIEMHHYVGEQHTQIDERHPGVTLDVIAQNDGLLKQDFKRWFFPDPQKNDKYLLNAIIHFTDFRY